jgi:hypothetical protein
VNRCGTVRGYFDHRKAGDRTCDACRAAKHDYQVALESDAGPCVAPGCDSPTSRAKGLCVKHLERLTKHGDLDHARSVGPDLFWQNVELGTVPALLPDAGCCWMWTGNIHTNGYGKFGGTHALTHRYAYQNLIGEIPDDLTIDHLCRVKLCVNPWHMEPVPAGVNSRRQWDHWRSERARTA